MELGLILIFIFVYIGIIFNPLKTQEFYYAIFGLVALLIFYITPIQMMNSIVFFGSQEPWEILVFFLVISFFSLALDKLGYFRYLASKMIHLANHDGVKLYKYIFILSAITSFFLSNDVVILTLTPLILNLVHYSRINPLPYLISMFIVANTSSIGLISSNITNLIVSNNNLFFIDYLKISIIPVVVTLLFQYFFMKYLFNKQINISFKEKKIDYNNLVTNNYQVNVFLTVGVLTLISFSFDKLLGLEIWSISLIGLIIAMCLSKYNPINLIKKTPLNPLIIVIYLFVFIKIFTNTTTFNNLTNMIKEYLILDSIINFSISTIFITLLNSIFLNIPTTTLLVEVTSNFNNKLIDYLLIISSNLGANFFIMGSLAGLMWYHFVKEKKVGITILDFVKYGFIITLPSLIIISTLFYLIV